jgi:hypothetical protein
MLPLAITGQGFETIAGRRIQVGQIGRSVEVPQLAARNLDQIGRKTLRLFTAEDSLGGLVPKASDHDLTVSLDDTSVNNGVSANDTADLRLKGAGSAKASPSRCTVRPSSRRHAVRCDYPAIAPSVAEALAQARASCFLRSQSAYRRWLITP